MSLKLKPLAEQAIVITGASSGIGLSTARMAAKAGASVLLVARSEAELKDIVAGINGDGGTADLFVADVGDAKQMHAAAAHAVERFGRIDTWVNNAGTTIYGGAIDTPDDEHEQLFRTNYWGVVHGCRAAVPHLREAGGALITVGSIGSDMPTPMLGVYSASKHAARAYVEVLQMELGEQGLPISITLVKPAGIDTPIGQHATNHAEGEAQIPPPTYAPEVVADAILHCAVHPKREITVGGAGRIQVLAYQHFKGLMQTLAPKIAKGFVDPSKEQPGPSNLWHGAQAGRERSGEKTPKPWSTYTAAMKHPAAATAIAAGAIGGAAWLFARRKGA